MSGDEATPERLEQLIRQLETTAREAHSQLRDEVETLENRDERVNYPTLPYPTRSPLARFAP